MANEPETALRRAALENTEKAVFLCDDSKIGKKSVFTVCNAEELDTVITNKSPTDKMLSFLKNTRVL